MHDLNSTEKKCIRLDDQMRETILAIIRNVGVFTAAIRKLDADRPKKASNTSQD